jgi:6-carboxyhexanoate--CoA ligase
VADFFNVRMRSSAGPSIAGESIHLSGGERLVPDGDARDAARELLDRAFKAGMSPDQIHITMERVPSGKIRHIPCLPVTTVDCPSPGSARAVAERVLARAGIDSAAISTAFDHIRSGFDGCGSVLRGAMLLDIRTGKRDCGTHGAGIRASRFDYSPGTIDMLAGVLDAAGLGHYRTREALALATKVLASGVVAELCWSDDPTYDAGYVSSAVDGYVRFPHFKPAGAVGGRVFFFDSDLCSAESLATRLKSDAFLIDGPLTVRTLSGFEAFVEPRTQR